MSNHAGGDGDPQTCFTCGKPLEPGNYYTPIQGWTTVENEDKPDEWELAERAPDVGFCAECFREIEGVTK